MKQLLLSIAVMAAGLALSTSAHAMPDGPYRDYIMRRNDAKCYYGDPDACYKARRMKQDLRAKRYREQEREYYYRPRY
jgi:hypothetical protein